MAAASREIYASSNGDRWLLAKDEGGSAAVRHVPNPSSGGKASEIELGAFLSRDRGSAQHQALVRLIGTLVEGDDELLG